MTFESVSMETTVEILRSVLLVVAGAMFGFVFGRLVAAEDQPAADSSQEDDDWYLHRRSRN